MIEINEEDVALIIGALDTLGTALSEHGHVWSEGEREIYERSISILTGNPSP